MAAQRLPPTIYLLTVLQALAMCTAPMYFLAGALAGDALAPRPAVATLPVTLMIVATAVTVVPVTRLMDYRGRKSVFLGGALASAISGLLAALALLRADFWLFCVAGAFAGISIAVASQYRFAAIERVPASLAGRATAQVLVGGLVAAWLGPELVVWGEAVTTFLAIDAPIDGHNAFVGGLLLLALMGVVMAVLVLAGYRNVQRELTQSAGSSRPLGLLLRNPLLRLAIIAAAMGYAMMTFIMTATPLSMHNGAGHSLVDTKWVIQSHIFAMFAPSLFSGWLITRLGHRRIIASGIALCLVCLAFALSGQQLMHYWGALVLLGVGWNFLFVGGTALLPQCYRREERFRVQSLNELAVFSCQAAAALSSGWIINSYGWGTLMGISALTLVVLLGALWQTRRAPSPATDGLYS